MIALSKLPRRRWLVPVTGWTYALQETSDHNRFEKVITLEASHPARPERYYQQMSYSEVRYAYADKPAARLEMLTQIVLAMSEVTGEDPLLILQKAPWKERKQSAAVVEAEKAAERMRRWALDA